MDAKTLEAVKASIAHWEKNAVDDLYGVSINASSCPLCAEFYSRMCKGCPVAEAAGCIGCNNTPWEIADEKYHIWMQNPASDDAQKAFQSAARAELAFLNSLLPDAEQSDA